VLVDGTLDVGGALVLVSTGAAVGDATGEDWHALKTRLTDIVIFNNVKRGFFLYIFLLPKPLFPVFVQFLKFTTSKFLPLFGTKWCKKNN
jgi:hypothetical protein